MKLPVPDQPRQNPNKRPKRPKNEDRFWRYYSRNHELPLSVVSSIFLHVVGYGAIGLILTGALMALFGIHDGPLPVESIVIAGGSGVEEGVGTGPADGALPSGPESIREGTQPTKTDLAQQTPAKPPPLLDPTQFKDPARPIEQEPVGGMPAAGVDQRARDRIRDIIAGKGKGGHGSGGGEGRGRGPGIGNDFGPGVSSGVLTQRQKRRDRWALSFNTRDGEDYLRQLNGLGAILAVPDATGQHIVYRDLFNRPVQGKYEDLSTFNQMYWWDEKPQSVRRLALALGLTEVPDRVIAFFPLELEKTLREREQRRYSGNEDDIRETVFRIVRRGSRYEPEVESIDTGRR
jgi:hypothetical protein